MPETDGVFLLKVILYIVLGTFWIKFGQPLQFGGLVLNGLPVGFLIGMLFAVKEKRQINRKIAYAMLIIITILCYFFPAGIVV